MLWLIYGLALGHENVQPPVDCETETKYTATLFVILDEYIVDVVQYYNHHALYAKGHLGDV